MTMDLKLELSQKRPPISFARLGLFSIILLGILLGVSLWPQSDQQRLAFSDISGPAIELLATISLFLAAKRSAARSRRLAFAWGAIAISMLLYTIGDSIWAFLDLVLQQAPFPSVADAFYLSDYVFFLAGVMLMINKPASKAELLNNGLDLATVLAAAVLGFWNFLIGPIIQTNAASPLLDQIILVAYPIGDLVLLGAVLLILYGEAGPQGLLHTDDNGHSAQVPQARQSRERNYFAVSFLVGGLLLWIVADAIYTHQALLETYVSGGWLDFMWMIANVLIGLAAASQWADMPVSKASENHAAGASLPEVVAMDQDLSAVCVAAGRIPIADRSRDNAAAYELRFHRCRRRRDPDAGRAPAVDRPGGEPPVKPPIEVAGIRVGKREQGSQ